MSSLGQQLRLGDDGPRKLTSSLHEIVPVPSTGRLLEIAYANRSDVKQGDIRLRQARIAQAQASDYRRPSLRASAFARNDLASDSLLRLGSDPGRTRTAGLALSFHLPLWTYDGGELSATRRIALPSRGTVVSTPSAHATWSASSIAS